MSRNDDHWDHELRMERDREREPRRARMPASFTPRRLTVAAQLHDSITASLVEKAGR